MSDEVKAGGSGQRSAISNQQMAEMVASVERSIAMVRDLRARFKREELDKQRKGEALVRGAAELRTKG